MPNGKSTKGADALNGEGLKGGVPSPEQPSATPAVTPHQAVTQGAAPVAPEPTGGILVMVTQEKHHKLPSPVPQGKSYKHNLLQATAEPQPMIPQSKEPKPEPQPTPEPAPAGPQAATSEPVPVVPQTNPGPEPAEDFPQGK